VAAGGHVLARYSLVAPQGGVLTVETAEMGGVVVLSPVAVKAEKNCAAGKAKTEASAVAAGAKAVPPKGSSLADYGFSQFEPVYFTLGFHERIHARFQLSARFRIFGNRPVQEAGAHVWEDFYATYTQTSLWDLETESKPFYDTSYKPALSYYRYDFAKLPGVGRFGFALGLEHESNGQGIGASRSLNIAFVRTELTWGDREHGRFLSVEPKVYAYLEKSENDDLPEYRGYGDYRVVVGTADYWQVATTFRLGTSGKGSVLMDASYPVSELPFLPSGWANGFLHLQYFNGYGETLRTYNQRDPWQVRVGFMLLR
jgi:outer membrane phospholipase A